MFSQLLKTSSADKHNELIALMSLPVDLQRNQHY